VVFGLEVNAGRGQLQEVPLVKMLFTATRNSLTEHTKNLKEAISALYRSESVLVCFDAFKECLFAVTRNESGPSGKQRPFNTTDMQSSW
jgi:hypothetical protein